MAPCRSATELFSLRVRNFFRRTSSAATKNLPKTRGHCQRYHFGVIRLTSTIASKGSIVLTLSSHSSLMRWTYLVVVYGPLWWALSKTTCSGWVKFCGTTRFGHWKTLFKFHETTVPWIPPLALPCTASSREGDFVQESHDTSSSSSSSSSSWLSPLSLDMDTLSLVLGGRGRAKMVWNCLRRGVDPMEELQTLCGSRAHDRYTASFASIHDSISNVTRVQVARDGTTKLLLSLQQDGLQVETVIIPWEDRQTSTLCISSQVGCRQGCTFCMTGRMGKLRSLSADEILAQVFHAIAITRPRGVHGDKTEHKSPNNMLFPIDNIVFMGMGEPADNAPAVLTVAKVLVDSEQYQFAPRRVTISTVAPHPNTFAILGQAPVVLAWSVHSSRNEIRKQLVPTTQHTMVELRESLIQTLQTRPRKQQSILLEVTLLDGINDSVADAEHLADFCGPIRQRVPHGKVVVNLIPWNDISASSGPAQMYRPPSPDRVRAFQTTLVNCGIRSYIRTTRGDDESAACGQLATQSNKKTRRP